MVIELIGALAVLTSTFSLVPQIIKMYQTRSVDDLSTGMIINFLLTSVLWVIYGFLIGSISVWVANLIMLLLAGCMIYFKFSFSES